MRKLVLGLWATLFTVGTATTAFAHGGGLDAYGCHHNRKLGGYHCHRGQFAGQSFNSQAEMLQKLNGSSANSTRFTPIPELNRSLGNPNTRVWVNASSGVYHCPRTKWYGATKRGFFTTQAQAQRGGNRPAYGSYCA